VHRVELASRAQRELNRVPESDRRRISAALARLAEDSRPSGTAKLKGNLYRLRIGPYRVIYAVSDREELVVALKIARREKDTYTRLEELF
jgi:mRNA interferase RelE/StbE